MEQLFAMCKVRLYSNNAFSSIGYVWRCECACVCVSVSLFHSQHKRRFDWTENEVIEIGKRELLAAFSTFWFHLSVFFLNLLRKICIKYVWMVWFDTTADFICSVLFRFVLLHVYYGADRAIHFRNYDSHKTKSSTHTQHERDRSAKEMCHTFNKNQYRPYNTHLIRIYSILFSQWEYTIHSNSLSVRCAMNWH